MSEVTGKKERAEEKRGNRSAASQFSRSKQENGTERTHDAGIGLGLGPCVTFFCSVEMRERRVEGRGKEEEEKWISSSPYSVSKTANQRRLGRPRDRTSARVVCMYLFDSRK